LGIDINDCHDALPAWDMSQAGRVSPEKVPSGLPAYKARLMATYVQTLQGRLELHFLPGYAPDLNPDEFVLNQLRHHGTTKKPLMKNESLRCRVEQNLAAIQNSPQLVRSFFHAPSVAYTMD